MNRREIYLVLGGLALLGGGVFWFKSGLGQGDKVEVIKRNINVTNDNGEIQKIAVDVSGEVVKPGVYRINAGSRVEDVLQVAGGLAVGADIEWVDKNINRALKLVDGQKVYIPRKGVVNASQTSAVNINSADQRELESLPGVGPVTAQKIISGRPYQNVSELVGRKILSQRVFDEIKDKISLW